MDITPLGNRVLVKRLKTTDITAGGLYIPETAKEKANVAVVLAVGKGAKRNIGVSPEIAAFGTTSPGRFEMLVKAGDRVLFGKYSGVDFEHEGDTLLFLREEEIFAILVDNVSAV